MTPLQVLREIEVYLNERLSKHPTAPHLPTRDLHAMLAKIQAVLKHHQLTEGGKDYD